VLVYESFIGFRHHTTVSHGITDREDEHRRRNLTALRLQFDGLWQFDCECATQAMRPDFLYIEPIAKTRLSPLRLKGLPVSGFRGTQSLILGGLPSFV
jgi:hypothetical protein